MPTQQRPGTTKVPEYWNSIFRDLREWGVKYFDFITETLTEGGVLIGTEEDREVGQPEATPGTVLEG